jgi:hypothetical protein
MEKAKSRESIQAETSRTVGRVRKRSGAHEVRNGDIEKKRED